MTTAAQTVERQIVKTTTLHFQEGGSDKIYVANVVISDGKIFSVEIDYGRRGSNLVHEIKFTGEDEAKATALYEKTVNSKIKKGYAAIAGDTRSLVATSERDKQVSGYRPQLLRQITKTELDLLLVEKGVFLQPKMDGERRMIIVKDGVAEGSNRRGIVVPLPAEIARVAVEAFPEDSVLDCEIIGEVLHVFDAIKIDGEDLQSLGFEERYRKLRCLGIGDSRQPITIVPTYSGPEMKAEMEWLLAGGQEGVVLRKKSDRYEPGKSARAGTTPVKYKFYETASAIVGEHNTKHSVGMNMIDNGTIRNVGNVTIPQSLMLPPIGSIIEVRYLYAYRGGSLYQPTYLGERNDLSENECTTDQLQYKQ